MHELPNERKQMGWQDTAQNEPWLLRAYAGKKEQMAYTQWVNEADVVVTGYRDIELLRHRAKTGKLTFYMSERLWKPLIGKGRLIHPGYAQMTAQFHRICASPNMHYLAIGHYAATDMAFLRTFGDRIWRWGYFTALPEKQPVERFHKTVHILWAGRLLTWKRAHILLRAASRLKTNKIPFSLDIVGDGAIRNSLISLHRRLGLDETIRFLPSLPAPEIRNMMRASDIYVLTSNGTEGWGAVVNEAMSDGCLVIACQEAGAARVLINDGVNGLLFRQDDDRQLADLITHAITDSVWRYRLARAGQQTIKQVWNPQEAAHRLIYLASGLLGYSTMPDYIDGPCSRFS